MTAGLPNRRDRRMAWSTGCQRRRILGLPYGRRLQAGRPIPQHPAEPAPSGGGRMPPVQFRPGGPAPGTVSAIEPSTSAAARPRASRTVSPVSRPPASFRVRPRAACRAGRRPNSRCPSRHRFPAWADAMTILDGRQAVRNRGPAAFFAASASPRGQAHVRMDLSWKRS